MVATLPLELWLMVAAHEGTGSMAGASALLRAAWLRANPPDIHERRHIVMAALARRRGVPAAIDFSDAWIKNCRARLKSGRLPPERVRVRAPLTPWPLYGPICARLGLPPLVGGLVRLDRARNTLRVIPHPTQFTRGRRPTAVRMPWAELGATAWMFLLADLVALWSGHHAGTEPMAVMATSGRRLRKTKWRSGRVVVYRSRMGESAAGWVRHPENRPKLLPCNFAWVCRGTAGPNNAIVIDDVNMTHPHALLVETVTATDVFEWELDHKHHGRL